MNEQAINWSQEKIKVLSLTQIWANLCVWNDNGNAEKQFETRSWKTNYRGELFIHASKGFPNSAKNLAIENETFRAAWQRRDLNHLSQLPFGAIVGRVFLKSIFHIAPGQRLINVKSPMDSLTLKPKEIEFGDYSFGRFAWQFIEPIEFEKPLPIKGALSIWTAELMVGRDDDGYPRKIIDKSDKMI